MESLDDVLPPEKIAFIAYNIGVFESVQKFGHLITSGKITNGMDVSKVAELLSESHAFYDAEMISQLINSMLQYTQNSLIRNVTAAQVNYVMKQLKATGVPLP
jgi:L-aminopeptidase/D-esterase-like protein